MKNFKNSGNSDIHNKYPNLAKPESDGMFCYHIQRRVSCTISSYCHSIGMSANTATFIDFCFAVAAALCFYWHYFFAGALFVWLFGLWSCVDGELARLSGKPSTLGDFYDTMTDRSAEFLIVASLLLAFRALPPVAYWDLLMFAYMGAVFLITNSSEKFRSVFHQNYPKNTSERLFSWLCAGSDIRLLHLSIGAIWFAATGSAVVLVWLILIMTIVLYINFIFRLWKIFQLIRRI